MAPTDQVLSEYLRQQKLGVFLKSLESDFEDKVPFETKNTQHHLPFFLIRLLLPESKFEEELSESLKINHMFGKVLSDIIRNSWPKDHQGEYEEDDELVFQHLLSWAAAKDIFQLHDEDKTLIEKLSEDARDRTAVAISSSTAISDQLVKGDIKISLLNLILEKRNTFLDLLKIECLSQNEQYKDNAKMRGLLQCRENEVKAVYHEKEVWDAFLTMSDIVGKHMAGMMENLSV